MKYVKNTLDAVRPDFNKAVFSIPVDFSAKARTELLEAAELAGIKVKGVVSESSAAYISNVKDIKAFSKVMVIDLEGGFNQALNLTTKLREENINVDMPHLLNKGMKQKMQYASRLGIPYVVIIGEDEVKNNVYALKDMNKGEQKLVTYQELLNELKND